MSSDLPETPPQTLLRSVEAAELLEVGPGRERLPFTGDDDDSHGRIALEVVDRFVEVVDELRVDGIELGRAVEHDHRHPTGAFDAEGGSHEMTSVGPGSHGRGHNGR